MSGQGIGIGIDFGGTTFDLEFFRSAETVSLQVTGENEAGQEVDLFRDVLGLVVDVPPGDALLDQSLTTVILFAGQLTYRKDRPPTPMPGGGAMGTQPAVNETQFGVFGRIGWRPQIDFGGETVTLDLEATVDLQQISGQPLMGTLCAAVSANSIPGLEFLKLGLCYQFGPAPVRSGSGPASPGPGAATRQLQFTIQIGGFELRAAYNQNPGGDIALSFGFSEVPQLRLGDILTFFASLVDPSIIAFEFDPPWNALTDIDLGAVLERIQLGLLLEQSGNKVFSLTLTDLGTLPPAVAAFLEINSLSLEYRSTPTRKTRIVVDGRVLGRSRRLGWDPVNDAPPEVPGMGASVFDLRYLGLGQHIALANAASVSSVGEVMGLLRGSLSEAQQRLIQDRSLSIGNPENSFLAGPIRFDAESQWLVGLDVSLLRTLNLSVIFNDPVIYGLRLELYGEQARNFAGLQFEILYQRITDTIGKYHVELVLPDFVRFLTVGAVSITLPIVVVDIFTNGDFKIDLGFPWNFDFRRSFAFEVLPFTGAGGVYFNKLSAATATSTPALVEGGGSFSPVYEFGVGLKVGLGKSFNSGPLRAELSVTVQGIIQGVFAYYNPPGGGEQALYYALQGGVAIVGRIYGAVDFVIIRVEVEVLARVAVQFMLESFQPIELVLTASVSVQASLTVLFIEVEFEFSLEVEESFTIDSPDGPLSDAPWFPSLVSGEAD